MALRNHDDDDWGNDVLGGLRDGEDRPDIPGGGIDDELNGRAGQAVTDKLRDTAAGKAKEGAKKAGEKAAKGAGKKIAEEAGKEGAKAAVKAGVAAGGGAATGGVVDAAMAADAALDKMPVIGQIWGGLKNRGVRVGLVVILFAALITIGLIILGVMMPIILKEAGEDHAYKGLRTVPVVRGIEMLAHGAARAVDKFGSTAAEPSIAWDGTVDPKNIASSSNTGATLAAVTETGGEVKAATASNADSRLAKIYAALQSKGYFKLLNTKYKLRVQSNGSGYRVYIGDEVVASPGSDEALSRVFQDNERVRTIMQRFILEDLYITEYSERVTIAEKGMAEYQTGQLYAPGADTATDDEAVAKVNQAKASTQNNPFVDAIATLCPFQDCGQWVSQTVKSDQQEMSNSITRDTEFKTATNLYQRMKTRLAEERDDSSYATWWTYVKKIRDITNNANGVNGAETEFNQAAKKMREEQASRLWLNWSTTIDQYKDGRKMTSAASAALFKSLEGGAKSPGYRMLNGQDPSAGTKTKNYEKVSDNQDNVVGYIYKQWKADKLAGSAEDREMYNLVVRATADPDCGITHIGNCFLDFAQLVGPDEISNAILQWANSDEQEKAVIQAGYELARHIVLPACDAGVDRQEANENERARTVDCMVAGAQMVARDAGIENYGADGDIPLNELNETLANVNTIDQRIAAEKPILERLTDIHSPNSFARTAMLQLGSAMNMNTGIDGLSTFVTNLPSTMATAISTAFTPTTNAATEAETNLNNIRPAGNRLSSLKNTPLSNTLDDPNGTLTSCPQTEETEENLCRADETTWLALACKLDLCPATTTGARISFTVGSYNILHSRDHTSESRQIGGCAANPVPGDESCAKTRGARQVQVITGTARNANNPVFDIVGTQETSPEQFNYLRSELANHNYDAFGDPSRMNNREDGSLAIFWNKAKFTKFTDGKARGLSNTSQEITNPWVGLQSTVSGQKVYVMSIHYAIAQYGGAQSVERASRLTMEWVKQYATDDNIAIVVGDFNNQFRVQRAYCIYTADGLMQHAKDMADGDGTGEPCRELDANGIDHIYATPRQNLTATGWAHMAENNFLNSTSDHTPSYVTLTVNNNTSNLAGEWSLPLDKKGWESNREDWLEGHTSSSDAWTNTITAAADLNIGSSNDDCGEPIYSMLPGKIVSNPPQYTTQVVSTLAGKTVIITYAHGNYSGSGAVTAGQQIGTVSNRGRYAGMVCHLHLEIQYDGRAVCPQDILPAIARGETPDIGSAATRARPYCR